MTSLMDARQQGSRESLSTYGSGHSNEKDAGKITLGGYEVGRMSTATLGRSTTQHSIIPMVDIKMIFGYIDELWDLSKVIYDDLAEVVNRWPQSEETWTRIKNGEPTLDEERTAIRSFGALFTSHADDLKLYLKFVDNYSAAKEAMRRSNDNSAAYRNFIADSLKNKDFQRQGIADFLILPIQRVTRYVLLLQDFKKHTPTDHADYPKIVEALVIMKQLANTVNEVKRNEEEMTRMFHIVRTVQDIPPTIISAQRRLVMECEGMDVTRDNLIKAFGPLQVGNSGFSAVPSIATIMPNQNQVVAVGGAASDGKDKEVAQYRLYIFSDVFAMAKAKSKKKWSMATIAAAAEKE